MQKTDIARRFLDQQAGHFLIERENRPGLFLRQIAVRVSAARHDQRHRALNGILFEGTIRDAPLKTSSVKPESKILHHPVPLSQTLRPNAVPHSALAAPL